MNINPYFELNGNKYEIKRTRWLFAEYRKLNEENPLSSEDKVNAVKASNLATDAKRLAEKEAECWEKLCEDPTEENQRVYNIFKDMLDKAVEKYNSFVSANSTLETATKHNIDILEKVAIKGLAEQYYSMNEAEAKHTWEMFVDSVEDHNKIAEWLTAMAECLFVDKEEEDTGFLSVKRKMDLEREKNRNASFRKKR